MGTRILIGADLVPTESNFVDFISGDIETIIDEKIINILNAADFTVFNLEVPLANKVHPIKKCGPNLFAPTTSINGIKKINPNFFTLANNHIFDQGVEGLRSTFETLQKSNIKYAGAGNNLEDAKKPYIYENDGKRIGIYCCAEHEFSIATIDKPGANPFDPLYSLDHISKLKAVTDFVIVLYHGGKEHYRYPSPKLQKTCRRIVEKGANLVICQHSHCIGCEEEWANGKIIYGQGNFIFDDCDLEFWKSSLLVEIYLNNSKVSYKYIPLVKDGKGVKLAQGEIKDEILEQFISRSENIKIKDFISEEYSKFAKENIPLYFRTMTPHNNALIYKIINKLFGGNYFIKNYSNDQKLAICNYLECEAHNELFIRGLKEYLNIK